MLSLFQILNLVAVNCTDHCDIKKLEATILEHVKNEELFPEVVRVLPPIYRQVEAAIVDTAQSEEMADHGEWSITPAAPSWEDQLSCGWDGLSGACCTFWPCLCGGGFAAEDLAVLLLEH